MPGLDPGRAGSHVSCNNPLVQVLAQRIVVACELARLQDVARDEGGWRGVSHQSSFMCNAKMLLDWYSAEMPGVDPTSSTRPLFVPSLRGW